jgi:hypothetical protein
MIKMKTPVGVFYFQKTVKMRFALNNAIRAEGADEKS